MQRFKSVEEFLDAQDRWHDELIRLPYAEYERLVHPTPLIN